MTFSSTVVPGVQEISQHKLDPLAVVAFAFRVARRLQLPDPTEDLLKHGAARGVRLEGETYGHEQLTGALQGVLLWHPAGGVTKHELAAHAADDLGGEQLPQEEVADELHVGAETVPPLLPELLEVVVRPALAGIEGGDELLELVLADIKHRGFESDRLAAIRGRELGEGGLQAKDKVCIGLAIMRLGDGLLENQLNDDLKLLWVLELDASDLIRDCQDVLRADLVEKALYTAT
eukprot:CAMPEP_0115683146 /NCGR_PEP_ID=MMETSP0272-20121206/58232_1 /TAXON_ID=71861 /ORGANISM="Scrippsiella trochoidea, Strain CCMP3099" /LENGTH=233 /DNA_ID=CAMNT_0003122569 /DNA_START=297 /DNA_END=999 /DNA_ORIENTATION=-